MTADLLDRIRGCLIGGAVGDAMGAPIEFKNLAAIRSEYGADGLRDFAPAHGRTGAITDDTQMTLFTAEGLVRAQVRGVLKGICHVPSVVHAAYLRWFATQRVKMALSVEEFSRRRAPDGWLVTHRALWSRRAPGNTCLSALAHVPEQLGGPAENDSKGCGAIMRVAPVGLLFVPTELAGPIASAFEIGKEVSALTHGHPSGYLSGAYFAELIANLVQGATLPEAIMKARRPLASCEGAGEVERAIDRALDLAARLPKPELGDVEALGGAWVGEEALAVALYCALVARDFEHGVWLGVNHGGDSDSTGSLVGNVLGFIHGLGSIPNRWLHELELRDVIEELATDLASIKSGTFDAERQCEKYPGW